MCSTAVLKVGVLESQPLVLMRIELPAKCRHDEVKHCFYIYYRKRVRHLSHVPH